MNATPKPRVLFVFYSFSQQTKRVADAMADELTAKGCDVTMAEIEFTDSRYRDRFSGLPMTRPILRIAGMLPAQLRRATGEIRIPPEAQEGNYDLVVFGSPTWWLTTNMPIRSYLKSPVAARILNAKPFAAFSVSRRYWKGNIKSIRKLGEASGGRWVDQIHFLAAGGQVKSMLSWLSYMKHGEAAERALGMTMPPPNLQPEFDQRARSFINEVVDRTVEKSVASVGS